MIGTMPPEGGGRPRVDFGWASITAFAGTTKRVVEEFSGSCRWV